MATCRLPPKAFVAFLFLLGFDASKEQHGLLLVVSSSAVLLFWCSRQDGTERQTGSFTQSTVRLIHCWSFVARLESSSCTSPVVGSSPYVHTYVLKPHARHRSISERLYTDDFSPKCRMKESFPLYLQFVSFLGN